MRYFLIFDLEVLRFVRCGGFVAIGCRICLVRCVVRWLGPDSRLAF